MNKSRRQWLLLGAGVTAAVAGAGLSWRKWAPSAPNPTASDKLWNSVFLGTGGESMPMAQWQGKPLLLNFWATWCPPCVEEMPMLSEFQSQHAQRIQVLGLAVDQVSAVKKFLDKTPVSYPVAMAGSLGLSIAKDLGNQGGGLPFSVFFDDKGAQMDSKVGKLDQSMLDAWLKELRG